MNEPAAHTASPPPGSTPVAAPGDQPDNGGEHVRTMTQSVGRGMAWMMMNTAVGRLASFGAQVALGYLLTQSAFGLFSIAVAVAAFVQVFRDGGIPRYIVQQGPEAFRRNEGTLFWMGMAFNGATSLCLAAAAPIAASIYGDPRLVGLLLVFALVPPLNTPAMIFLARLNMEMRFATIAKLAAASAIVRHASMVLLAWQGAGVYSFVVPLVITAAFDSIVYYLATRDKPWKRPANVREWPGIFRSTGWLMVGSIASGTYNMGEYLVLPAVVGKAVQGVYFFGYQLSKQIVVLVLLNLQIVLLPALSRIARDPERLRAAILRSLRLLMLVAAPVSFGLVTIVDPLIAGLWVNGRWAGAAPVVQVLAAVMALNIMAEIPRTVLMSIGRFRLWSGVVVADMIGLMASALAGGWLTSDAAGITAFAGEDRDPFGIALAVGCYSIVATTLYSTIALRKVGVSLLELFQQSAPALLFALFAAAAGLALDQTLLVGMNPWLRVVVAGSVFSAIYLGLARGFLREDLHEVFAVVPQRFRPAARRLLGYAD